MYVPFPNCDYHFYHYSSVKFVGNTVVIKVKLTWEHVTAVCAVKIMGDKVFTKKLKIS